MVNGLMLKFMGELFYLIIAGCAVYATWNLFRDRRKINSIVIKTHVTAYELQKLIEGRARQ